MDPMDPPKNTSFSDSMRPNNGWEGIRSRKIQGSAFWKGWKIPENKEPRPSSSSPIEIRHAVGRGAMEERFHPECFIVEVRQLRIAVRRSRAHSCGSDDTPETTTLLNLVETPLASGTVRFRSSIKETSDSWETCACEIFHLENLPFFSHRF